jgi:hypothetical protein
LSRDAHTRERVALQQRVDPDVATARGEIQPLPIDLVGTVTPATPPLGLISTTAVASVTPDEPLLITSTHLPAAGRCQRTTYMPGCEPGRMSSGML